MIVPRAVASAGYRVSQHLRGRGRMFSLLAELARSQFLSVDELDALQWRKVRLLLEHARDHVPYYAALFRARDVDIERACRARDLSAIPLLTKEIIREHHNSLLARGTWLRGASRTSSSGSTGQPLQLVQSAAFGLHARAHQLRNYGWCGYRIGDRFSLFWGSELYFRSKQVIDRIEHAVTNRREFNTFRLSPQLIDQYIEHLLRFRPTLISTYPSSLYIIGEAMARKGIALPADTTIQTTSEILTPEMRSFFGRVLQAEVFDKYGSRETNVIAHECPDHDGMHINMENTLVEFLDGDDQPVPAGGVGEIVVTNLNNFAMPLIRYRMGDLGVPLDGCCSCGITLRRMKALKGRVADMIRTGDGGFVDAYLFSYVLMRYPEIHTFQVVQHSLDAITILLRLLKPVSDEFEREVSRLIHAQTGGTLNIRFEYVDDIPVAPSGKHRATVSLLNDAAGG